MPAFSIASSTAADCARSVARGFSINSGSPRSTAARMGATCRCSSVAMMAAVTSGRVSSSRWSWVTKIGAYLVGDLAGTVGVLLGQPDPADRWMARGNLAAEQADPAAADDGEADPFRFA